MSAEPTIDRAQLWVLLKCYLRLSFRGKSSRAGANCGEKTGLQGLFWLGLMMYGVMGLMMSVPALEGMDLFTYSVLIHSMTLVVVGMAVTSESGDILFNRNESDVLLHRPIHPRTLLLAKTLNLILFTLILSGALNLAPAFSALACPGVKPWYPLTHFLLIILDSIFASAAVVCSYGIVMRFVDRERFDNFAAGAQMVMTMLFFLGSQLVPRLMVRFKGFSFEHYGTYMLPFPPVWFASVEMLVSGSQYSRMTVLFAALGLGVTLLLAYNAIGKLAPDYGDALARLNESSAPSTGGVAPAEFHFNAALRWWCNDPIERQSFLLARAAMFREREVKMRLYPSLCYIVVWPVLSYFGSQNDPLTLMGPLMGAWMLGCLPMTALTTLQTSSNTAAAEIFAVAPLPSSGPIFHGTRKAVLYYLAVPLSVLLLLLTLVRKSDGVEMLLLALPAVLLLPTMSLLPGVFASYLPLCRPVQAGGQVSRNSLIIMGSMFGSGILLTLTWLCRSSGFYWHFLAAGTVCAAIVHILLLKIVRERRLTLDDF